MKLLRLTPALKSTSAPYNQFSLGFRDIIDQTIFSFQPIQDIKIDKKVEVIHGSGSILSSYLILKDLAKKTNFDIIHIHNGLTGILFILAVFPFNLAILSKCVFTLHNSWYVLKTRNQVLDFLVMMLSASVCTCGKSSFESIPKIIKLFIGKKMIPIVNGFDNLRVDNVEREKGNKKYFCDEFSLKILYVGALNNIKNQIALLKAAEHINRKVEIIFLGDGNNRQMLIDYAKSIPSNIDISFKGIVSRDIAIEHMLEADLYISLSKGEGLPIAVLEAMYAGCFLILSNISPHLEVSPPQERCIFVELSDQRQIIESINYVINRLEEVRSERHISKEYSIANFSVNRMLEEYKEVYNSIHNGPNNIY